MADDPRLLRLQQVARPVIGHTPPLPAIDFAPLGPRPLVPDTPDQIPGADVLVICWAEAEWVPLQHVFVAGAEPMPYADRRRSTWPDWKKFGDGLPPDALHSLTYWGYYRLVKIGQKSVLLFKSNTHLDEGHSFLEKMMELLIERVRPGLVMSTGTAGGARNTDPVRTVNVVNEGTLYESGSAPSTWPQHANAWKPDWSVVGKPAFQNALFPVPATDADLSSLVTQFNKLHGTSLSRAQLDPLKLNDGARVPAIHDLTPKVSLLSATSFLVANTGGNLASFACVEMDDAVIGKVCNQKQVPFGFVRNISDPIQNGDLPVRTQGDWGSFVYEAYGFYTSYNGALAAWAILAG